MRIRIIGSCGSGKSTMARELSEHYGIPYYELDNMIWDRSREGLKYPQEVRNQTLKDIAAQPSWIIEGVQYQDWTWDSIHESDFIFILNPHVLIRDYRIVRRFIRSRTGIEPWNYKQSVHNLIKMIVKWNHGYDLQKLLEETHAYPSKRYVVQHKKEIIRIIQERKYAC
ncbi:hypothetical protein WMW72_07310 [Paenibacillus filicis]|uniref:DNA topology modulation protein FlaR n=1 Tax=Paenibacillus filicis TaxID=669464 RepID=A0ABU9DIZ0_9BACL